MAKQCPMCGLDARDADDRCNCGYLFYSGSSTGDALQEGAERGVNDGTDIATAGIMIIGVGAFVVLASFAMETSVSTGSAYVRAVENVGLLQRQMMVFEAGALMIAAGIVCAAIGYAVRAMKK